jgi:hypothetical protein
LTIPWVAKVIDVWIISSSRSSLVMVLLYRKTGEIIEVQDLIGMHTRDTA